MPLDRRRQGETQRSPSSPSPTLKRPSNPTTVAKAVGPPTKLPRAGRPARGKKGRGGRPPRPVPASVTMSVAGLLRGEAPAPDASEGIRWGVLYRLVVRDADGRPIAPGSYTIRRHLLHLSSSGCFAAIEKGARISTVELDADGGTSELVGIPDDPGSGQGEERLVEYFSFELEGVTYAIPRSGFLLARSWKAGRLEVARAPRAVGSVHGAVVPGLVGDGGGDTYVLAPRD